MTTAALLGHVAAYAAQVRTHLSDLPADQVDDLTDGLEADLAEALADSGGRPVTGEVPTVPVPAGGAAGSAILDLAARFGDPAAYAAELRSAAGMPPSPGDPDLGPTRGQQLRTWWEGRVGAIRSHPAWQPVSAFAQTVRPAWWVARGWALFGIVFTVNSYERAVVAPSSGLEWVVFLGFVWLSVEYGRGRWHAPRPVRWLAVGLSVLAALFVLPGVATMSSGGESRVETYTYVEPPVDGVYVGGSRVTNLFVYDADGEYVEHAQLLDNQGRAVTVDEPDGRWIDSEQSWLSWFPLHDVDGREVRNAYPVPTARSDGYDGADTDTLREAAVAPAPPVRSVAPLDVERTAGAASPSAPEPDPSTSAAPAGSDDAEAGASDTGSSGAQEADVAPAD